MVPLCHSSQSGGGNHLPLSQVVLTLGLHFSPKAEIPGAAGSKTPRTVCCAHRDLGVSQNT